MVVQPFEVAARGVDRLDPAALDAVPVDGKPLEDLGRAHDRLFRVVAAVLPGHAGVSRETLLEQHDAPALAGLLERLEQLRADDVARERLRPSRLERFLEVSRVRVANARALGGAE